MSYIHKEPLLTGYQLGAIKLKNRVTMSSLTRGRTVNPELAPIELHARYYAQRASAGLILTESAWVSRGAIGFVNIPGIYSDEQISGWKMVTHAVHANQGKIFLQIAHSGAVSHPDFFNGQLPLGPSAINPQEKTFTPEGFKDTLTPKEYSIEEIKLSIFEFQLAARNAKDAGFDGVEIHAQLFTLIPQFLSEATNQRTDAYGGSIENRCRILFEILDTVRTVFADIEIGIKFTPAAFNPGIIKPDQNTLPAYDYILNKLNAYDLAYVHLVGPAVDLTDTVLASIKDDYFGHFRKLYKGTIMANLGFDQAKGNEIIANGKADLVSFGTKFIANPDLVERFDNRIALAEPDRSTFYSGGEKGYVDYPTAI
jgi:N-ethylmaleimide reductase